MFCPRVTILGQMNVFTVQWSGQYLDGSLSIGSSLTKGQLVVAVLFLMNRGLYSQKYLRDIIVSNQQNFTIGSSLGSDSNYFHCQYCRIINEQNATFFTNGIRLSLAGRPALSDNDGFGSGIINKGLLVIRHSSSSSYVYWYWDLRNTGNIKLIARYRSSSYFYFYGRMINNGLFQSYGARIYFQNGAWFQPCTGSYEIYSYPFRYGNAPSPVGQSNQWQWKQYLNDVYQNVSHNLWDPEYPSYLYIQGYSLQDLYFNNISAFGRVQFNVQNTRAATIYFSRGLNLGHLGEMTLNSYSLTSVDSDRNKIIVGSSDGSIFTVDLASIEQRWTVEVASGSSVETYRRLIIEEGAEFVVHPGTERVNLNTFVGIKSTGGLSVYGRNISVKGDLHVLGTLNMSRSDLTVSGEFRFPEGLVGGQSSRLHVTKLGNISSNFGKTFDGISLYVQAPTTSTDNGVIAEYFQYRVNTDITSKISSLYYFPGEGSSSYSLPSEFNNPSTEPNTAEFAAAVDRTPRYYSSSPIAVTSTLGWFDSNAATSFTYSYASRLWTFLQIDQTGSYTFYVDTGYGLHVQLWINDQKVFTSSRYHYFLSNKQSTGPHVINAGLCRLRVDFIQESSSWTSQNVLIVTYSGPSFTERALPLGKLFVRRSFSNGTIEYANPGFNRTKFLPPASSVQLGGQGLIFAKNGATVVVTNTGILDVVDDITWFSDDSFGGKSSIVNYGTVVKTGDDGVATFFADYISRGGSLITNQGLLEFRDATKDGGLTLWNNPNGGNWLDPNNWVPARVPGPGDVVHITLDGTYLVIIPGHSNVSVLSLTLGSATSFPELVLGHYGQLFIADRLDIYSKTTTFNGVVTANHVTWTGERIRGSDVAGEIVAKGSFVIIKGSYGTKYLSSVNVTSWKSFTVDASLNSDSYYLYCDNCFVLNLDNSTMLTNNMRLSLQQVGSAKSDGFRTGLINYGLAIFEIYGCCVHNNWDIRNYGETKILAKRYGSSNSFYVSGTWINYNLTQVYATTMYLQNSRPPSGTRHGIWNVYSYPVRYQYAPSPVGENVAGAWKEYLADVYQNVSDPSTALWDPGRIVYMYIRNGYFTASAPGVYDFGRLNSYGSVEINVASSQYVVLNFQRGLQMGRHGRLNLLPYSSSSPGQSTVLVGDNSTLTVGIVYIRSDWNVSVGANSTASFYRYVTVYENGVLTAKPGSTLTFNDYLTARITSLLNFSGATVVCLSRLSTFGSLELGNGSLTVHVRWDMSEGSVTASGGTVRPYGGWNITGDSDKTLKGVNVALDSPPAASPTKNGVIVDYFQYRVDTNSTTRISSLYYFPGQGSSSYSLPSYFNQASASPNIERIETTVHRYPAQNGNGPLYLNPSGGDPDLNNAGSFTYNYAARLWTFVKIDISGNYTFYFLTGYSLSYRLWIDGQLKVAGSKRYSTFLTLETAGPFSLLAGYRKIRIDFIQESSSWSSTGNTLLLYYSGPGFSRQLVPHEKFYYHNGHSYAKSSYVPVTINTAWMSGEGLILAQDAVNVTICSTCELQVVDDILWYSDQSLGGVTSFINSGLVIRTGQPGTASIYGKYVGKPGSIQKTDIGLLEFRDAGTGGGLAIWINPNGGSWTDPQNWSPQRVPRPEDVVHITQPGTYQVIIPSYSVVNITSLSIGSSKSSAELVVEQSSSLNVQDRIGLHAPRLTLRGLLQTSKMTWTGQYLSSSQSSPGKLVVTSSLIIIESSYDRKYLEYVTLESKGNLTLDSSFASDSSYFYCTNCFIYSYGTLLLTGVRFSLGSGSPTPQLDGFRSGIVNYGTVITELQIGPSYSRYFYFYWDIRNYGNISVINKNFGSTCYSYIYGAVANYGKLRFYMTHVEIRDAATALQMPKTNGSWEMYGKPYRYNGLLNPPGDRQQGNWQPYLDNLYQNQSSSLWDVGTSFSLYVRYISNQKSLHFNSLQFYGKCHLDVSSVQQLRLHFETLFNLGLFSDLYLRKKTNANDDNQVICYPGCRVTWNRASIEAGWSVGLGINSTLSSSDRVVMLGGASLNSSSGVTIQLNGSLVVVLGSRLNLVGSQLSFADDWIHKGDASLKSTSVFVDGMLQWERGAITGIGDSSVELHHGCRISGTLLKTISGVEVTIAAKVYGDVHGVVAEYFQYRVSTSTTSPISSLYYFPGQGSSSYSLPVSFDSPNATANKVRLEPDLTRPPRFYRNSPITYLSDSLTYDSSSANFFSYNYAARLWTYLKIDKAGLYTFYFQTGYGLSVRFWVDGTVYFISKRYVAFLNEEKSPPITLGVGYRNLRIDYIQSSSSWSTEGGTIIMLYEGPDITKQIIPTDRLYSVLQVNGQLTGAAENWKFLQDSNVCRSTLTVSALLVDYQASVSHCAVEGTGVVVTGNRVNITVEESGILDLRTDTDWPVSSPKRTELTVKGMVIKTQGSGKINLNTNYELVTSSGCLKSESGTLELGVEKGNLPIVHIVCDC